MSLTLEQYEFLRYLIWRGGWKYPNTVSTSIHLTFFGDLSNYQDASWELRQEIFRLMWNTNVHYIVHNSKSRDVFSSHSLSTPLNSLKINFNITLASVNSSFNWTIFQVFH